MENFRKWWPWVVAHFRAQFMMMISVYYTFGILAFLMYLYIYFFTFIFLVNIYRNMNPKS